MVGIAAFICCLPSAIFQPAGTGIDASWVIAINHAISQQLAFGSEFIFTYGPLGYLATGYTGFVQAWPVVVFSLLNSAIMAWLLWRIFNIPSLLSEKLFVLLAIYFAGRAIHLETGIYQLVLVTGLIFFNLERPTKVVLPLLAVYAAVSFFIKLNTGLAISALVVFYLLFLWYTRRCSLLAVALTAGGSAALILIAAALLNVYLPAYLANSFAIVSGYNEVMQLGPTRTFPVYLALAAALTLLLPHLRRISLEPHNQAGWFTAIALMGVLVLSFKQGFVRADMHQESFFAAAIWLGLFTQYRSSMQTVQPKGFTSLAMVVVLGVAGLMPFWRYSLLPTPYRDVVVAHSSQRHPAIPDSIIQQLRGPGADIFPWDLGLLAANSIPLHMRPVPQSYLAAIPRLMRFNTNHYRSEKAPVFVLFAASSIDNHHPFWYEPETLKQLLTRYRLVKEFGVASEDAGVAQPYVLLQKVAGTGLRLEELSLGHRKYKLGETIRVPQTEGIIAVKLSLSYSWLGKWRALVYQPEELWCELTYGDGKKEGFEVLKPIMTMGLPLIMPPHNAGELSAIFQGRPNEKASYNLMRLAARPYAFAEEVEVEFVEWKIKTG